MTFGFQGLDGIIQSLKDQADEEERKKQLAAQAAALRASLPPGPLTQAQSMGLVDRNVPQGVPYTHQPVWHAPMALPHLPIASPQPFPQVQRPVTNTQTPPIQSSQVSPTVQSPVQAPPPQVQPKVQPQGPSTPTPLIRPVTPLVRPLPSQQPSPLAQWRGAPPVGVIMPQGPQLAGQYLPTVLQTLGAAASGGLNEIANGDWTKIDYGKALGQLAQQAKDGVVNAFTPHPNPNQAQTPLDIAGQMTLAKIQQRHKENQFTAVPLPDMVNPYSLNNPINKGALTLGMDVIDLMGYGIEAMESLPAGKGQTLGVQYAKVRDVGDQMNANAREDFLKPIAGMMGMNQINAMGNLFTGHDIIDATSFAVLDPRVWGSISNLTQYWDLANKRVNQAFVTTPDQQKNNTPAQIDYAKNLAMFMAPNSIAEMQGTFKETLDTPGQIADLTNQAQKLIEQADAMQDPIARQMILNKAGQIGAQAAKLRETTPLDLYNKHTNLWYSLPASFLFDPVQMWGAASELGGLTPIARRAASAEKVMETAAASANETVADVIQGGLKIMMQTKRSKSMSDAYTVHNVMVNMLSSLTTKGDLIKGISKVLDGSIINGIPLSELNGPEMALQAVNGVVPFDKAGVFDFRFQDALKNFQNILGWVPNLPSLAGDPAEVANKLEVQGDLLGMLTRGAAQSHNVSTMGEVPWGAKTFEVVPTQAGRAFVQWVGDEGRIMGQSAETSLVKAGKMADRLAASLKTGGEFQKNYVAAVGDFRRAIVSNIGINSNLGAIIGNAMSGGLGSIIDGTGMSLLSVEDKLSYLGDKLGGFIPDVRIAGGAAGIEPAKEYRAMSTGTYQGVGGKILNFLSLGLGKAGRELRQGTATVGGLPVGEEALALNVYHTAFRSFFEEHWNQIEPALHDLLTSQGVTDEASRKYMVDSVLQAGHSGGRELIADVFNRIANGLPTISLRSITPWGVHVFTPDQVIEIDSLLSGLTPDTLGPAKVRIGQLFREQEAKLAVDSNLFVNNGPGRNYFTNAWNAQDLADIERQLSTAAQRLGKSPDEVKQITQEIGAAKDDVLNQFFSLFQMTRDKPNSAKYMYDVWNRIINEQDVTRQAIGALKPPVIQMGEDFRQGGHAISPEMVTAAWDSLYKGISHEWQNYGMRARQIIENARDAHLSGNIDNLLRQNVQPIYDEILGAVDGMPTGMASDLLSDASTNIDEALNWLGTKVGWKSKDPVYALKTESLAQGLKAARARMFIMLSRYGNAEAFDEFASAYHDTALLRNYAKGKIAQARKYLESVKGTPQEYRGFAALNEASNKWWDYFFKEATDRAIAGAYRIGEVNLPQQLRDTLNFRPQGATADWKLIGPHLFQKNMWNVVDENGVRTYLAQASRGAAGVPQATIDAFNTMRKASEQQLWEEIGRLANESNINENAYRVGSGMPSPDTMLQGMGGAQDMVAAIRQQVAEYAANYNQGQFLPADLHSWNTVHLDAARSSLNEGLDKVAAANAQGYGRMGLGSIGEFNKNVLPAFDNIITGAQDYARKMMGFTMVDFTNQYHPDVLLSLAAPYHYWWSRMSKNAIERLLFNPKVFATMGDFFRGIESINRQQDQPARNVDSLPAGIQVGDTQYRPGASVLFRWIPFAANMIMSGYADPDIANRAFEYGSEQATNEAFPNTSRRLFANALYGYELAKQMGLNTFGDVDALVSWAAGNPQAWQGAIGQMSPLYRTLGYGAVRVANWAKDNNVPLLGQVAQAAATATVPGYMPYLTGRTASFEAARGNLTDDQARMAQDVAAQDFSKYSGANALSPLPEQAFVDPNAAKEYEQLQNQTASEYFIRGLVNYLTGIPVAASYGPELELRKAKAMQRLSGYDAGKNPAGSQTSYYSYTDPKSANYQKGLSPFNDQYAVTAETAPGVRDPSVKRPGLGVVQDAFYNDLASINDKYKQEQADTYKAHPEWSTTDRAAMAAKSDYDKDWAARKKAELTAVAGDKEQGIPSKYPSVSDLPKKEGINTFMQRPSETVAKVQDALVAKAYDMAGDKTTYASSQAWYDQVKRNLAQLMNDPKAIAGVTYGDSAANAPKYTPDRVMEGYKMPEPQAPGVMPSPTAPQPTSPVAPPTVAPVVAPPVQPSGGFTPDPKNQWVDLMAEQEKKYNLPPGLLQSIARHESGFDPGAGNTTSGAEGMMQFEPSTWAGLPADLKAGDPMKAEDAIKAAAYYLSTINASLPADKKNNPGWMAAAYNVGGGAVTGMTSYDDIANLKQYADAKARAQYAKDINQEVSNAGVYDKSPVGQGSTQGGRTPMPFAGDFPLTQEFGVNPERYKSWGGHMGLDFKMPTGTPVLATQDGTVVDTGYSPAGGVPSRPGTGGFGNWIIVQYPDGYTAEYAHLQKQNVKPGDKVAAGDTIGLSDHTGVSDFPHLHFGVRKDGKYIDPHVYLDYLKNQPLTTPASPVTLTGGEEPAPVNVSKQPSVAPAAIAEQQAPPAGIPSTAPPIVATAASFSPPYQAPAPVATTMAAPPPSVGTTPPVAAGAGTPLMPWTAPPDQLLNDFNNRNNSPERVAAQASVDQAFTDIENRAKQTYPQYGDLYDQYQALPPEQKADFTAKNPMIRALHLAGYSPDQWSYLEKTYGSGIVEKWANRPPYTGEGDDSISKYYHQYPDVFLANAYIRGRPEVYDDSTFDPTKPFEYNFGKDYAEAQSKYGPGIWDTVRQYYTIPAYTKGGDNTQWFAFKRDHPEFDAWRIWWYEKLGDQKSTGYQPYQSGYQPHAGYSNGRPGRQTQKNYVAGVQYQQQNPPSYQPISGSHDDWKQWLSLTDAQLKGWRR